MAKKSGFQKGVKAAGNTALWTVAIAGALFWLWNSDTGGDLVSSLDHSVNPQDFSGEGGGSNAGSTTASGAAASADGGTGYEPPDGF